MLASEQFRPRELLDQARRAYDAGFEAISISDHFHPWNDAQGNSPFVWSLIWALSESLSGVQASTMVTCPTFRVHPVVLAHVSGFGAAAIRLAAA